MDGTRQAIRWSIPGFIFVLEVHILHAAWTVALGSDPFTSARSADVMSTLAIVFAGIPLGFLLYQLYYRNYKPLGRSMLLVFRYPFAALRGRYGMKSRWTFVRRDRGAEMLRVYDERGGTSAFIGRVWPGREQLASELADVTKHRKILGRFGPRSLRVLTLGESLHQDCGMLAPIACGDCREAYRKRFQFNWSVVIAVIDYASNTPNGSSIRSEYAGASDIYHALGAARTAIATAAIAVISYHLTVSAAAVTLWRSALAVIVVAALAYAQYQVLHSARESVSRDLTTRTAANLAWFSRSCAAEAP